MVAHPHKTPCHYDPSNLATRTFALSLALSLFLSLGSGLIQFAEAKTAKALRRDFLPPVAIINAKLDEYGQAPDDQDVEPVILSAVTSPTINTTPKVERLAGKLDEQFQSEQMQSLLEIQQKVDEADLEHLWKATVEKNPVIRFSLEKLATPPDLQSKQSSKFLKRTLSTMISGVALGSSLLPGGGAYRDMGTMAVGNALQNMVEGRTQPNGTSLSATEQIQMAGLIDDLKIKLIHSYQDYKNTLQSLADSHNTTIKNNNLYSKALASKNDLAIMAAATAYYQSLQAETKLRQKAKLHRLELERLAGQEAVSDLQLAVVLTDGPNVDTQAYHSPDSSQGNETNEPLEAAGGQTGPPEPQPIGPEAPTQFSGGSPQASPALTTPDGLPEPMELPPSLGADEEPRTTRPLPLFEPVSTLKPAGNKPEVTASPTPSLELMDIPYYE